MSIMDAAMAHSTIDSIIVVTETRFQDLRENKGAVLCSFLSIIICCFRNSHSLVEE